MYQCIIYYILCATYHIFCIIIYYVLYDVDVCDTVAT